MTVAVVAPLVLLLVTGLLLGRQIRTLVGASEWVAHTNNVVSTLNEIRVDLLNMEASMRAYLLTDDKASLEGFEAGTPELAFDKALALTKDNPLQQERLVKARKIIVDKWLPYATSVATDVIRRDQLPIESMRRKGGPLVDARTLLKEAIDAEEALLRQRRIDNAETERQSTIIFIILMIASAGSIAFISRRELGSVTSAFQTLILGERIAREKSSNQEWIRRGEANIAGAVVGERDVSQVATAALETLVEHTGAAVGAIYQVRGKSLQRVASHAVPAGEQNQVEGGALGQVVADGKAKRVADAKAQVAIGGGVAQAKTVELVLSPASVNDQVIGVIELGFQHASDERTAELMRSISTPIALAIRGAEQRARLKELLEETQRQGEELQTQHEELRVTNEELEHQSTALREANARQAQIQHELEATNANLEEQTALLEQQREELQLSQKELQERARELQQASQYKSEFLARMSHELRTPLNSTLILARLLGDNPSKNLTDEQVKYANTIYSAGNDLLLLINDILDLAKIEAGRLELRVGPVHVARVRDTLTREFEPVAQNKGLTLKVEVASDVPAQLMSDEQRLVQVMRNLVSNACKFTDKGEVTISVASEGTRVRFDVRDTGIGIPPEHVDRVFDAFHQVDGGVARKHGGTGLGLAISRDLAALLGGTLTLKSTVGQGTVFSLVIPVNAPNAAPPPPPSNLRTTGTQRAVQPPVPSARTRKATGRQTIVSAGTSDDRDKLDRQKRTLLVIEDDAAFAQILVDLGRELGFQALAAPTADEGVALALEHHPDGILLDVNLPDHSGLTVLERIKRQPMIRHIPVHMISGTDHAQRALELGAIGYLMKPANRDSLVQAIKRIEERTSQTVRRLLIVEDDAVQADALTHLLGGADIEITSTDKVSEALGHLSRTTFDCVVMDLRLTDGTGFELLEKMTADERITFPPVIVHTGKDLSDEEESKLRGYSSSIIVKGARSPERLLDEVALFLHQVEAEMPPDRQRILREVRSRESVFEGKRVLVVEDDVRNVFALTSILEPRGLTVSIARNGREALEALDKGAVDIVLMDIMMPEMDGLEATRRIRQRKDGAERLPIIALTAKAMADDRQACLDAGANDYLAKPIDIDMLLSLLRVWMPR